MAESVPEWTTALADRYRVDRELGRGGMATVYLAHDLRHDRPVALKVLHPELAVALGADRFQREIRLAARLQHPHILTVHDSGEIPGNPPVLWFSMPYIEGESLRDRLSREKQLPVDEAVRITREAADALDYAHRHGVIHRDIKPENILLSEGHALVADFGIGKALAGGHTGGPAGSEQQRLTETGMTMGTPAYMSPEQAAGAAELDARTDIYSLATVLYEMLAGATPFDAPTAQAMIARRFTETPRPLRAARDTVPETVEAAVERALSRTPADRFATAAEFARALGQPSAPTSRMTAAPSPAAAAPVPLSKPKRRVPVAATSLGLGFLLGLGLLFGWLKRHGDETPGAGSAGAGTRLLAVLPFENLGGAGDEYFADGVTDEIRGKLAGIPGLRVTASRSAAEYKKSTKSLATIARELGVDYLLVGKVRWEKAGEKSRVRVSPELIDVTTGSTKWQQPFDANLTDVFQVQADVASRVAQALDVALGSGEKQALADRPTSNLAAYDAFLKGEEISNRLSTGDPATLRRSLAYYEQAIGIDSSFVLAWVQRARAATFIYANGVPDPELAATAQASAERAQALAPGRPEPYLALADYARGVRQDQTATLDQSKRGLAIAPTNVDLLVSCALGQQSVGNWAEATELLRRAQAVDPRSVPTGFRIVRGLLWLRRYDEALAASDRTLKLAPSDPSTIETRAMIFVAQGDTAGARETIRRAAPNVDPATLVAYFANFYDLFWLLDDNQRKLLFRLTPASFDGDRGAWGVSLAGAYDFEGNKGLARAYADSARVTFEQQIRDNPADAQLHALLGVALAYVGRAADAAREGERAVEMLPASRNAFQAAYNLHQLARIYVLTGQHDKAIDKLEILLKAPYFMSPGWLRVDPTFDHMRKNPRFQKLVEDTA